MRCCAPILLVNSKQCREALSVTWDIIGDSCDVYMYSWCLYCNRSTPSSRCSCSSQWASLGSSSSLRWPPFFYFSPLCVFKFSTCFNPAQVATFSYENPALLYVAMASSFILIIALVCVSSIRRKSPHNLVFLGLFTLCESWLIGQTIFFSILCFQMMKRKQIKYWFQKKHCWRRCYLLDIRGLRGADRCRDDCIGGLLPHYVCHADQDRLHRLGRS